MATNSERVLALEGRDLDRALRNAMRPTFEEQWKTKCRICGWPLGVCKPGDCGLRPAPAFRADEPALYSTSLDAVRLAELEIVKRGLGERYTLLMYGLFCEQVSGDDPDLYQLICQALIMADATTRARAILLALSGEEAA